MAQPRERIQTPPPPPSSLARGGPPSQGQAKARTLQAILDVFLHPSNIAASVFWFRAPELSTESGVRRVHMAQCLLEDYPRLFHVFSRWSGRRRRDGNGRGGGGRSSNDPDALDVTRFQFARISLRMNLHVCDAYMNSPSGRFLSSFFLSCFVCPSLFCCFRRCFGFQLNNFLIIFLVLP